MAADVTLQILWFTSKPHVTPVTFSSLRSQFEGLSTLAKHALKAAGIRASVCAYGEQWDLSMSG